MLAATSAAIAAAKAARDALEDRMSELKQQQPRAWVRVRDIEIELEAVSARLAALEDAARAEDDAEGAIVVGVVLAAGDRHEVDQVRKQLWAMPAAELLASVAATRAARQALAGLGTVAAICDRRDHDTTLKIADRVAAERGITIPAPAAVATRARERGNQR